MAGILLPSFSLVRNSLLPTHHNRQIQTLHMRTQCTITAKKQQQQQDYKLKIVAVSNKDCEPPKIHILSTEEEEEEDEDNNNIITISCGYGFGHGIGLPGHPVASCHEFLLTAVGYNELAIWNPNDDKVIKTLPQSSVPRSPFVETEMTHLYGFGFDPRAPSSQRDYKVIRFYSVGYVDGSDSFLDDWFVELYSHKTRSWKPIPCPHQPRSTILIICGTSIYINGFYYWRAVYGRDQFVIVPFDFANDTFPCAFIPGPTFPSSADQAYNMVDGNEYLLVEFEGSLGVIKYFAPDEKTIELELWVWKKNNNNNNNAESWSRRGEWVIRVPGEIDERSDHRCWLLGLFKNDQLYIQDSTTRELLLFDCAKQKLKNLGVYAEEYLLSLFPYVERSAN